ncbi:TRAP dicarboxylate transporter subunit DctM [Chromatiales bacterium (ex Bugula neritina AB1)]|nr:TRAP dicarboxylate transporter subunit DctM [Chromatiales bacterium (ex Bugula neritina AB1)]
MPKMPHRMWVTLGALSIAFHLWLVFSGLIPNLISRPLHMALALPWIFFGYNNEAPSRRFSIGHITGLVLGVTGICLCLWIAWHQSALGDQYGYLSGNGQIAIAAGLLIIVLEMARRAIGWPLPLVALVSLAYAFHGQHLPGEFGFTALPLKSILGTLTIAEGGVWGKLTGISVNVVAVFVIFGAILNAGEAGQGFKNLAAAAGGRLRGGAAKVSVLSSALFGSISGSASANVASTGAFTLPAMTRLGYPKPLAAATEAVASSGGQIMPPLMGAGAFVMVELTGVPYTGVMSAALLPALLYFFAVWIGIDAYSRRYKLAAMPEELIPETRQVLITTAFFLVPFGALLLGMFLAGFTPQYSVCIAGLIAIFLLLFDNTPALALNNFFPRIASLCVQAGSQIASIAAIILCASIIIGVLGITGLGVKITSTILAGSGGNLWLALTLTAFACLILGMEVPTTAAYVICVSVAGPALTKLGLSPLQAHLFVFWYALLSTITPPVCGAVFIAAGMVQENWLAVAAKAMALGIGLYLIPLAMVAEPALLQFDSNTLAALLAFVKTAVALTAISFGVILRINLLIQLVVVATGVLILFV